MSDDQFQLALHVRIGVDHQGVGWSMVGNCRPSGHALGLGHAFDHLAQDRQQGFAIGMVEIDDPKALIGATDTVHPADEGGHLRNSLPVTAQDHRVGRRDRRDGNAIDHVVFARGIAAAYGLDNPRHLCGGDVCELDHLDNGRVAIEITQHLANTRNILGVVNDDKSIAALGRIDETTGTDHRTYYGQSITRSSMREPDHGGDILVTAQVGIDRAGTACTRLFRNDLVGARSGRDDRKTVHPHSGQENLEILIRCQGRLRGDRDPATYIRVDDKGVSGHRGHIVDHRLDFGLIKIHDTALGLRADAGAGQDHE